MSAGDRAAVGVLGVALLLASSCRDPTEITLRVTSNTCGTLTETGIAVGPAAAASTQFSATQSGCQSAGFVGSLVVIPSGSTVDPVGIQVVGGLGKDPATCTHGDPQCIVARRSLRFVPHAPLTLPIALDSSCAGVACDDPTTTCLAGSCVPAAVDCPSGTCTLDGGVADAAPVDGAVEAGVLDASADAGSVMTTLASAQSSPVGLYVDSTDVYWTSSATPNGSVMKCAIGGCTSPTVVAANQPGAFDIAGDATNVYWTDFVGAGGQVAQAPKAGGATVVLATNQTSSFQVSVGNNTVYWTNNTSPGSVTQCLVGGCNDTPTTLASTQNGPGGIVVDGTKLYWTNVFAGQVMVCSLPACTAPVPLASGQGYPEHIAVDATNVYWTNYTSGTVVQCSKTGCGTPTTIASGQSGPNGLAVDATDVYWTTLGTNGTVMKCAKAGCGTPTTLASNQSSPWNVAVDATSVYWTNRGAGTVMKLTPK